MKNRDKGGCLLSAGQQKSVSKAPGMDLWRLFLLYSVACLCDTRWVLGTVSPPPPRQRLRSIAAVAPSLQLNCWTSWQASRTAIWIPAEPQRGPETSSGDEMCSSSQAARQNSQQEKSVYGCEWMFLSFCTTFYERPDRSAHCPSLVAQFHRAAAWTANAWPLTLCAC